jgi:hypothetical protein
MAREGNHAKAKPHSRAQTPAHLAFLVEFYYLFLLLSFEKYSDVIIIITDVITTTKTTEKSE